MTSQPAPLPRVAWITDIEGRWDKLQDFTRDNPAVRLTSDDRIVVEDNSVFVFGGDAVDRGPDGQRLVRALLDAHIRQPDRVVLLAGNRDINKLRLVRELNGHPPTKTPEDIRSGPRAALLQWIFAHTMGARGAFEHRRVELAGRGEASDDESVTQSYLTDLAIDGPHTQFLARCQLLYRHGDTLFAHGFISPANLGRVPGVDAPALSVDRWIEALNQWYRQQMDHYLTSTIEADGTPAYTPLVAYQAPVKGSRTNDASVVYARPTDNVGTPFLPAPEVVDALRDAGVRRLLVGHTPSGDTPAVLRCKDFELVLGDNSYGRIESGSSVVIDGPVMEVRGNTLTDAGHEEAVRFSTWPGDGDRFLGLRDDADGYLVKARLASGDYVLFRTLPENRVEQIVASPSELEARSFSPPWRPAVPSTEAT